MSDKADAKVIGEGKFLRLMDRATWEFVDRPASTGVVDVVAVTEARRLVLVEQARAAFNTPVIELPAGLIGDETGFGVEQATQAAARELREETGFAACSLTEVASGAAAPGHSTEHVHVVLATGLTKVSNGGGTADEDITVHEVPFAQVLPWLEARRAEGAVIGLRVYTGLFFAQRYLADGKT